MGKVMRGQSVQQKFVIYNQIRKIYDHAGLVRKCLSNNIYPRECLGAVQTSVPGGW